MNDKEIILLLKRDPSRGLYEAIEKYNRLVRTLVRRILPNRPADAEECVEDTFVNIWRRIDDIDPDTPYLKAYILRAARNIAITRYRQMKRSNTVSLDAVPEPIEIDIAEDVIETESNREIREAVMELEEPERGIFFRRYFLFESYKRIAQALRLSETQVKNTLYRKKSHLRKKLEERGISYETIG